MDNAFGLFQSFLVFLTKVVFLNSMIFNRNFFAQEFVFKLLDNYQDYCGYYEVVQMCRFV